MLRFAKLMSENDDLADKVKAARGEGDFDAIVALGQEKGCDFSKEELEAFLEGIGGSEGFLRFCQIMSQDPSVAAKAKAAGTDADAIVQLGREHGCEFAREDVLAFAPGAEGELSEDQLDAVAGGAQYFYYYTSDPSSTGNVPSG